MWRAKLRGLQGNVVVKPVAVVAHVFGGRLRNVLSLAASGLTAWLTLRLIGRTLTAARQRYVFDSVWKNRDPAGLDLERRHLLAALFIRPAIHDRATNHHHAHALLEQSRKPLGILMPPFDVGPEATPILVAALAIRDRVVEHHIESQHVPRIFVAVGERPVLSSVADVAFPNYWCTHGVSPFSVEVGS